MYKQYIFLGTVGQHFFVDFCVYIRLGFLKFESDAYLIHHNSLNSHHLEICRLIWRLETCKNISDNDNQGDISHGMTIIKDVKGLPENYLRYNTEN